MSGRVEYSVLLFTNQYTLIENYTASGNGVCGGTSFTKCMEDSF
jgi:hypothetical protein